MRLETLLLHKTAGKQLKFAEKLLFRGGSRRRGGLLEAVSAAELLAEPFHAAGGVDELLFAGKERVAGAANIHVDLGDRASRGEGVSARTVNVANLISRMSLGLHGKLLVPGVRGRISPLRQPGQVNDTLGRPRWFALGPKHALPSLEL
jgi:hypothetical protein